MLPICARCGTVSCGHVASFLCIRVCAWSQKLLTSPAAVSDARIEIDTLFIEHRLVNVVQLSDLLVDHFAYSIQSQIPAILGSVDALGNPTAFFRHISTGLRDAATEFVTVNPFKATGANVQCLVRLAI